MEWKGFVFYAISRTIACKLSVFQTQSLPNVYAAKRNPEKNQSPARRRRNSSARKDQLVNGRQLRSETPAKASPIARRTLGKRQMPTPMPFLPPSPDGCEMRVPTTSRSTSRDHAVRCRRTQSERSAFNTELQLDSRFGYKQCSKVD